MKKFISISVLLLCSFAFSQVGVGTNSPDSSSILDLDVSSYPSNQKKGFLPPRITEPERDLIAAVPGLVIYNTTIDCLQYWNSTQWIGLCEEEDVFPGNVTLDPGQDYFMISVYDSKYWPWNTPTTPASTFKDDVGPDPLVDIKGILTATGIKIRIPYTVVDNPAMLPAFYQEKVVVAGNTNNNTETTISLSYDAQTLPVGSGYIEATIKPVGDNLQALQLDVNYGIGNDFLGVLLAQFGIPKNSTGELGFINLRAIAGIPDVNYGNVNHKFLYMPKRLNDNKVWLTHSLGAEYTKVSSANFSPKSNPLNYYDKLAYGSLFQWGRPGDGHELVNWQTSPPTASPVTNTRSSSYQPGNNRFIAYPVYTGGGPGTWNYNWTTAGESTALWNNLTANNPCPKGFRPPSQPEISIVMSTTNGFVSAGTRVGELGPINTPGNFYWTITPGTSTHDGTANIKTAGGSEYGRYHGMQVRCIKN